ncbi:hypothetical protein ACET3X_008952 [Alternaria dauci]|uniref:Uncharacterized protein n=1 Tax=Alternaria dauci TaxID=48095 RepID=A0ABR3U7Y1_9PLEO
MPDKYPQSSSFKVEQYLETSAHHPPTLGFGATALFVNDVVELTWPLDFEVPVALHRSLYCKPCQQKIEDVNEAGEFDWESCYKRPDHGGIWSRSFDVMGSGMVKVPVRFDFFTEADTMVCAFGFPGAMPGGLSQAFPVINKTPPRDRGRRAFTPDAPQGLPYGYDEAEPWSMYVVGGMVFLGLGVILLAGVLWQRRKQRKAQRTLKAGTEEGSLVGGVKTTRYTDNL